MLAIFSRQTIKDRIMPLLDEFILPGANRARPQKFGYGVATRFGKARAKF